MGRQTIFVDYFFAAVLLLFILLILAGCSGSELQRVQIPAFEPSINMQTETRLKEGVPPVPAFGLATRPATRLIYSRTLQRAPVALQRVTIDRRGLEGDGSDLPGGPLGGRVTVVYERAGAEGLQTVLEEYALPRPGEILDIEPTSRDLSGQGSRVAVPVINPTLDVGGSSRAAYVKRLDSLRTLADSLRAQLRGAPRAVDVDARVPAQKPGWFTRTYQKVRDFLAFIGVVTIAVCTWIVATRFTFRFPWG